MAKKLNISDFQTVLEGGQTDLFFLENRRGVRAAVTNYGARLVALWVPDRDGQSDNIVAGYRSIQDYLNHEEIYLGATVGRFANRIKGAEFQLNGQRYKLTPNEGENQLHGGPGGLHQKVWNTQQNEPYRLELYCQSEDGSDGYPGNLQIRVTYSLDDQGSLEVSYSALSDKDTILNVTNHSYFNLGGESREIEARDHHLKIHAAYFLPVGRDLIPVGKKAEVEGTPFDFRQLRPVNEELENDHPQLKVGKGYDHHFVLDKQEEREFTTAAKVIEPITGRMLELKTTEPGLQFFECTLSEELDLNFGSAFCLETQHFPDAPNNPDFPSVVLKAGERFHSKTSFRFSVADRSGQQRCI